MVMRFNQEIMVPGQDHRRRLNDFSSLNVTHDILSIKFYANEVPDDHHKGFSFNVTLADWFPTKIMFLFNLSDPVQVSNGKFKVKIRNPGFFIAKESGEELEPE